MAERPQPLEQLDSYFAAATIAHEFIADLHLELARLNQDNDHTRSLLREAADAALTRMPQLTGELRRLEHRLARPPLPGDLARQQEPVTPECANDLEVSRLRLEFLCELLRQRLAVS